jgi:tetratricopeptide (TPR) repeat protein
MAEKAPATTSRIEELTRKLQKEPGSRIFLELAREYHVAGILEEAARVCRDGLVKHAGYHSARVLLGRLLIDLRRFAEARPELEKVVRQAPDNLLARRLLGEALHGAGETTAALDTLRTLLRLNPSDGEVESLIRQIEQPAASAPTEMPREAEVSPGAAEPDPAEAVTAALEPGAFAIPDALPEVGTVPAERPTPPGVGDVGIETLPGRGAGITAGASASTAVAMTETTAAAPASLAAPITSPDRKRSSSDPEPERDHALSAVASAPVAASAQTVAMRLDQVLPALSGKAAVAEQPSIVSRPPQPAPIEEAPSAAAIPTPTLAEIYLQQGMPERALSVYEKLLQANPNDAGTLGRFKALRARLHPGSDGGDHGPASHPDTEAAGGVIPTPTLAEIYLAQGQKERALEVLRQVLEGDPDNDEARARLSDLEGSAAPVSSLNERKIRALQSWMERIRRAHVQDRARRVGPPASGV